MDNKEKFKKIRMEDVYKAIEENGFYTTPTEKHYDENFIGPELIVVTDDPDFKPKTIEKIKELWYRGNMNEQYRHYSNTRYHALNLHSYIRKKQFTFHMFCTQGIFSCKIISF